MPEDQTPKVAATSMDPNLNGAGTTVPEDSPELHRARVADDLQKVRRALDRISPAIYAIAYFVALGCFLLGVIARRIRVSP